MTRAWGICGLLIAGCILGEASAQTPAQGSRALETDVELAWMSDPITFPYELRAYVKNGVLEVHGVVPGAFVRKQALGIAQLHARAAVADKTDLKADGVKPFVAVPRNKVVSAGHDRVSKSLPQLATSVIVECNADGRATLTGAASTQAEKVALSELMRRVPGCLSVDNRVRLTLPPAPSAPPAVRVVRHESPTLANPAGLFERPITGPQTEQMREKLVKLCPGATGIFVYQLGPRRFQIQFSARSEDVASQLATRIFDQQEWKQFQLDIGAHVPR